MTPRAGILRQNHQAAMQQRRPTNCRRPILTDPAPFDPTPVADTPVADATAETATQAVTDHGSTVSDSTIQMMMDAFHSASFLSLLAVFVLAIFVGYYVVWHVTPALHSPLMAVTNAISSVIIVGALIAAGTATDSISTVFGFLAVVLASVNIFGGFLVTRRMLSMFKKKVR